MNPRIILSAALWLVGMASAAWAERITVNVDGMVCAFCAAGIEQLLNDEAAVAKVQVDLDASEVRINTKEDATLSDDQLREIIRKSGFTAGKITRG